MCPAPPGEAREGQRATRPRPVPAEAPAVCPTNLCSVPGAWDGWLHRLHTGTVQVSHTQTHTHAAWGPGPAPGLWRGNPSSALMGTDAMLSHPPPSLSQGPWLSSPTGPWGRFPPDTGHLHRTPWGPLPAQLPSGPLLHPCTWGLPPLPSPPHQFSGFEHEHPNQTSGLKSQLCCFRAMYPWKRCFASLGFSLIYKVRITAASMS